MPLIDEFGPPPWFTWSLGHVDGRVYVSTDGTFCVHAENLALLRLYGIASKNVIA
jgi:hypothetical protein